ncbi:FAD dependent oxidoreductase [Prosthecobacter debontii]|uniref:FAD dependent oxidoreductase n=1 Tax=Prosthecobacter debontii TaxID=48467 RepID=A0A1T4X3X1_9BACT|nr:FAD-dependent oxidoreductase [Prosthecobacter debontii]SKA84302.1 FAD dependent oxidoreductase [Prosthecobacter debontii]
MRLVALSLILAAFTGLSAADLQTDVCIYGATPGGVAAALSAARSGSEVVLVEPTARIGGLLTSGLSHTDFHSLESLTGSFLEFSQKVKAYYVKTYGADSEQVKACFEGTFGEPKVNLLILEQMLAGESRIQIHRGAALEKVEKEGTQIGAIHFKGLSVHAKVFVDGSYEGDLLAKAGVSYHVGREGRDDYGESLAPEKGDSQLQAYNFRFCATDDSANRVPIAAPAGYKREDFLPVLDFLKPGEIERVFGYPSKCIVKAQTPALPNHKYDLNDVSRGLVRLSMPGHNLGWPEGDAAARQAIFAEHLRYNVGLLYFLINDEAVPAHIQEPARAWGWCKDEFTETDHLPPQLYVREARRMTGEHIYVQQDSEHAAGDARAKLFTDSIAMGDYGNNCHGTSHEGPQIGGKHGGELYNPVPPYQIPYGALVPKAAECTNLLVPVALSSSHVGFCALRLEPIWMSLGQATGHAAALAAKSGQSVQDVPVPKLQTLLWADHSATLYVADVPPGHTLFTAVQWWGTAGGLHGLNPMPAKLGQRGKNLHGQYYEANPGHAVELDKALDDATRTRWLELAQKLGVPTSTLTQTKTRGGFIEKAFTAAKP